MHSTQYVNYFIICTSHFFGDTVILLHSYLIRSFRLIAFQIYYTAFEIAYTYKILFIWVTWDMKDN